MGAHLLKEIISRLIYGDGYSYIHACAVRGLCVRVEAIASPPMGGLIFCARRRFTSPCGSYRSAALAKMWPY